MQLVLAGEVTTRPELSGKPGRHGHWFIRWSEFVDGEWRPRSKGTKTGDRKAAERVLAQFLKPRSAWRRRRHFAWSARGQQPVELTSEQKLAIFGARRAPYGAPEVGDGAAAIDLGLDALRLFWRRISAATRAQHPDLRSIVWLDKNGSTVAISERDGAFTVAHSRAHVRFDGLDDAELFAAGLLFEREGLG
jgi:hypothetical protein